MFLNNFKKSFPIFFTFLIKSLGSLSLFRCLFYKVFHKYSIPGLFPESRPVPGFFGPGSQSRISHSRTTLLGEAPKPTPELREHRNKVMLCVWWNENKKLQILLFHSELWNVLWTLKKAKQFPTFLLKKLI